MGAMDAQYVAWAKDSYQVAAFRSGSAEQEVQWEKKRSVAMDR